MHVGWLHLCLLRPKVHLLGKTRNFGPKISPSMVPVHYLPLGHLQMALPGTSCDLCGVRSSLLSVYSLALNNWSIIKLLIFVSLVRLLDAVFADF